MGVYRRRDSRYYWIALPAVQGERAIRESTNIPIDAGSSSVQRRNRQLAEDLYAIRAGEMARDRLLRSRDSVTVFASKANAVPLLPLASEDGWCYIYFVQRGASVKVGKAINPDMRVKALQTSNHEPLRLVCAVPGHAAMEKAIHERFRQFKISGEWFQFAPPISEFIAALKHGWNPVALLAKDDITQFAQAEPKTESASA